MSAEPVPTRPEWPWLLLVFAGVALFYAPTLPFAPLPLDDYKYILDNPWIRVLDPRRVLELLGAPYFSNYHPLTVLSYAVDYQFAGTRPPVYRGQNILWGAASAVILAILLRTRFGAGRAACLLAFLWAVSPLRYESIVWLSERKDVISVFFVLVAFGFHTGANHMDAPRYSRRVLPWELAALLLSLLAKGTAVTYFALVLAHDALRCPNLVRGRIPAYAAMALLCVVFAAANLRAQSRALRPQWADDPAVRAAVVVNAPWHHATRSIVPVGLAPVHPVTELPVPRSPATLGKAAFCIAFAATALLLVRRAPATSFGMLFFGITLLPVSGIVPLGFAYVADRYSFLPSVGLYIAAADILARTRDWRGWLLPAAITTGILCTGATDQLFVWRDVRSVLARVCEVHPTFIPQGRVILAQAGHRAGIEPEAAPLDDARDEFGDGTVELLLAQAHLEAGRLEEALRVLDRIPAERVRLRGLMQAHARHGDRAEARRLATELAGLPGAPPPDVDLAALTLAELGANHEARRLVDRAAEPSLERARAMGRIAAALAAGSDPAAAEALLPRAERIDPTLPEVVEARLALLTPAADPARVRAYCLRILGRPEVPRRSLAQLAAAYASAAVAEGDIREALAAYRIAVATGEAEDAVFAAALACAEANGERALAARCRVLLASRTPAEGARP